jgi:hypothetical protein
MLRLLATSACLLGEAAQGKVTQAGVFGIADPVPASDAAAVP